MPSLIPTLTKVDLNLIHANTLKVLGGEGVVFHNQEAIAFLKKMPIVKMVKKI